MESNRLTYPQPKSVASLRDALDKRTINHVACSSVIDTEFLNDVLLDIPETFSYQILTELISLPGNMLPHEVSISNHVYGKHCSYRHSNFLSVDFSFNVFYRVTPFQQAQTVYIIKSNN